jgi:hypothetical protein
MGSGAYAYLFLYLRPAPPPFSGISSSPAFSNADKIAASLAPIMFFVRPDSKALMVSCGTPELSAKSEDFQLSNALAAFEILAVRFNFSSSDYTTCVDTTCVAVLHILCRLTRQGMHSNHSGKRLH